MQNRWSFLPHSNRFVFGGVLVIKDDELHTDIHRLPGVTPAPVCSYMYERKFGRSLTACNLQEVCTCTSVLHPVERDFIGSCPL